MRANSKTKNRWKNKKKYQYKVLKMYDNRVFM